MSAVANEIYRQLGGNRFRVMTGAKNMVSTENGIRMRIGLIRPMRTTWK